MLTGVCCCARPHVRSILELSMYSARHWEGMLFLPNLHQHVHVLIICGRLVRGCRHEGLEGLETHLDARRLMFSTTSTFCLYSPENYVERDLSSAGGSCVAATPALRRLVEFVILSLASRRPAGRKGRSKLKRYAETDALCMMRAVRGGECRRFEPSAVCVGSNEVKRLARLLRGGW